MDKLPKVCSICGKTVRIHSRRQVKIKTLVNFVTVERINYRCVSCKNNDCGNSSIAPKNSRYSWGVINKFLNLVHDGYKISKAARIVGISSQLGGTWKRRYLK